MGYVPQSIQLRRDKFTRAEAVAWIRHHGYHPIKEAHITPHFYRFRLVDPERLRGARFRTIDLGKEGEMTIAYF